MLLVYVGDALDAAELFEFGNGADAHDLLIVVGDPQRNRVAPVTVARYGPVARVRQPVGEALLLGELGHPVRLRVVLEQALLEVLDLDEPARHGLVEQRRVRAPAERILMLQCGLRVQAAVVLEVLADVLVSLFHVQALEVAHLGGEEASRVDRTHDRAELVDETSGQTHAIIVLAEVRRLVHNACAGLARHVRVGEHTVAGGAELLGKVVEERLVVGALVGRALALVEQLVVVGRLVQVGESRLHQHELLIVALLVANAHVLVLGMQAESDVAGQRPGRGGPREERVAELGGAVGAVHGRKGGHHRRILDVLVVLAGLEVRERRAARGRVGHDLEAAVDEVLLVQLLEHPPHGLHKRRIECLVVVLEVDPAAEARYDRLPLVRVAHDDLAALVVVVVDAHLEHVLGSLDAVRLVDLVLDGQAVTVPAEAALHMVARLRGPARHRVLDRAGQYVAVVRQAGGERRTVVERELLAVGGEAQLRLERVHLLPHLQHVLLFRGKVEALRLGGGSSSSSSRILNVHLA